MQSRTDRRAAGCGRSCTCTTCRCAHASCTKPTLLTGPIVLRHAEPADAPAIERLARLDSTRAPEGDALVAEHHGALVAAVTLDGRTAIGDPFRPTAALVTLLRAWSDELRLAA